MIDPKTKSLRLLTVAEASSHDAAKGERQKVANFIHDWLYGAEPTPQLHAQLVRIARPGQYLPRKPYLN